MATIYDCSDQGELLSGMRLARAALGRGELAVIPTDTVYGVAADAFMPDAVARLLAAKGRGRDAPPPVLIPNVSTMNALAAVVPPLVNKFADEFWPGALTIVLPARGTLAWDLGDTAGTVALRIPANRYALELLADTGPLAVSSANKTGLAAAQSAAAALEMLGDEVAVYLDDPESNVAPGAHEASTIIDATSLGGANEHLIVLRAGAVSVERLRELAGDVPVVGRDAAN